MTAVVDAGRTGGVQRRRSRARSIDGQEEDRALRRDAADVDLPGGARASGRWSSCRRPGGQGADPRVRAAATRWSWAGFALDVAAELLARFEAYFGIPYPFGKLDLVARARLRGRRDGEHRRHLLPRGGAAARPERAVGRARSSDVALIIAHEMAHQWFGDLVTMRWWDDLWLNEAFATWAENALRSTAVAGVGSVDRVRTAGWARALAMDALAATHADPHAGVEPGRGQRSLRRHHLLQGRGGAAHARALARRGDVPPRRGDYLHAHPYGNATADDLWRALAAESHQPVGEIARAWIDQPGLPLVTVTARCAAARPSSDRRAAALLRLQRRGQVGAVSKAGRFRCARASAKQESAR